MTNDGSGLGAFELLVWVTLIPLFVVLVGRAIRRDRDDAHPPVETPDESAPDETRGGKRG